LHSGASLSLAKKNPTLPAQWAVCQFVITPSHPK
jgi:hypothetical protein